MIYGNLILAAVPLVIAAIGAFCAMKEQKLLFCLICGAAVYFVAVTGAADGQRLGLLALMTGELPISSLADIETPPAYMLMLRICLEAGIGVEGFTALQAALQAFLAAAWLYNRDGFPYAGAAVFTACFLPLVCVDPNILTAVLVCLFGAEFIEERRFFRFAAVIFAAACFDISVLLLIPVWFIALIPKNYIVLPLAGGIAAAAVLLPDVTDKVFEFLGKGRYNYTQTPLPLAICAAAAALLLMLTAAMFRRRSEKTARVIPVFITGAALSFASVYDARLFVPAQAALALSATALLPDAFAICRRFTVLMFPRGKKAADITAITVCAVLGTALCAYIVFGDCFGTSYFGRHLFGEVSG